MGATLLEEKTTARKMLFFRIAGKLMALPRRSVLEVQRLNPWTPVPNAPPELLGVMNLRGEALPVVMASRKLGLTQEHLDGNVVVVEQDRLIWGLLVEQVIGVGEPDEQPAGSPPPQLGALVQRMLSYREQSVPLLNVEQLFTLETESREIQRTVPHYADARPPQQEVLALRLATEPPVALEAACVRRVAAAPADASAPVLHDVLGVTSTRPHDPPSLLLLQQEGQEVEVLGHPLGLEWLALEDGEPLPEAQAALFQNPTPGLFFNRKDNRPAVVLLDSTSFIHALTPPSGHS